jgi:hypothetical protein
MGRQRGARRLDERVASRLTGPARTPQQASKPAAIAPPTAAVERLSSRELAKTGETSGSFAPLMKIILSLAGKRGVNFFFSANIAELGNIILFNWPIGRADRGGHLERRAVF